VSARHRIGAACLSLGIVVLFMSLGLAQRLGFDFGTLFGPCGFRQRYGLPCPTCGMTTAVLAFARGQIVLSFWTQPGAGLLCSILAMGAVLLLAVAVWGKVPRCAVRLWARVRFLHVLIGLGLVVAAGWLVTWLRAVRG